MKRVGLLMASLVLIVLATARFAGAPMITAAAPGAYGVRLLGALGVLMAIAAALVLDRLVQYLYLDGYLRRKLGRETPALIEGLITIALLALGGSIGLYYEADVPFTGLITASGATAVVLGLALQEAIKDVFGGLSLNIDGSIIIGDWLTLYSERFGEPVYGRVQGITWRSTFLHLDDGRRLVVPNHVMTTNPVINHSRPSEPKRLFVEMPVSSAYSAERAMSIFLGEAYRLVRANPFAARPQPDAVIDRFDSTTNFIRVRFYAHPDKVNPEVAKSLMSRVLHAAMIRHKIAGPVSKIEIGPTLEEPDPDHIQARNALAHAAIFKDVLDAPQLDALAKTCQVRVLGDNAAFIRQGETGTSMFVILEGVACVSIAMADGEERDVAILVGGDIVGEMSLMTGAPRTATVKSLTAMRIVEVTKESIEPLLAAQPSLLERFSNVLAVRQSGLSEIASSSNRKQELELDILAQMRRFFSRAFG